MKPSQIVRTSIQNRDGIIKAPTTDASCPKYYDTAIHHCLKVHNY